MILAAAKLPVPGDRVLDGIDPTAILTGSSRGPDRMLFWEYGARDAQAAVRHGRYKLIRTSGSKPFELYDLAADPGELRNIASRHPDVVGRLTKAYHDWIADTSRTRRN